MGWDLGGFNHAHRKQFAFRLRTAARANQREVRAGWPAQIHWFEFDVFCDFVGSGQMMYRHTWLYCFGLAFACDGTQTGSANPSAAGTSTVLQAQGGGLSSGGAGTSASGGSPTIAPSKPCTGTCPHGTIRACVGSNCPLGPCAGTADCESVYRNGQVDADTVYCSPGQNGDYCLTTFDSADASWKITCTDGTPTSSSCAYRCGVAVSDGRVVCE